MLGTYRVLDLTDERGQLAGAILAGLGAEVILVEPPGGSSSRRCSPFAGDSSESLWHWAYNRGKRSVELDLTGSQADREALRQLAAGADVLIESGTPGELDRIGFGYDDLRDANPALVYVSITPFGQDGPKAWWPASDLTICASAMILTITGDNDRPPVRMSLPQAFLHAAGDAAGGALLALHERARSGLGQHVDVSAQQSALMATFAGVLCAPLRSMLPSREAGGVRAGPFVVRATFPCKDGYVAIAFFFGAAIGPATGRLMEWIFQEGFCDEATRDKNWIDYALLLLTGQEPMEEYERLKTIVETFTLTKTSEELLEGAVERRLLMLPASTIAGVVGHEQYAARGFWDDVVDDAVSAKPIRAPGAFAKVPASPLPALARPPRAGEHTRAVLSEPSRSPAELPSSPRGSGALPLEGVKVLDLMWVVAGPSITRVLADYGATVVRVESQTRVETARTLSPFMDDVPDPERTGQYWNWNAGKLGFALNLAKPGSRDVVLDLVRWADVVTESFSPRAMRQWGLDYEALREVNPSIVMLSSCLMGQTGPLAEFAGYGNLGAAFAGFFDTTGWPDRPPAGPFGAYTDVVSPRFGLAALLAALDRRRRTGEGTYIDLSQAEASIHFLTPAILDYTVNGRVFSRRGNDDEHLWPHGVYPCAGEDQWVAIACESDEQRGALRELVDAGADDARLDAAVAAWTASLPPAEAAERCIAAGVPAHAAQNSPECAADPQLRHRGHFAEVEHATFGRVVVEGPRFKLSRTPGRVERAGPTFGEDTARVLSELLGYSEERIGDLFAAELLE